MTAVDSIWSAFEAYPESLETLALEFRKAGSTCMNFRFRITIALLSAVAVTNHPPPIRCGLEKEGCFRGPLPVVLTLWISLQVATQSQQVQIF